MAWNLTAGKGTVLIHYQTQSVSKDDNTLKVDAGIAYGYVRNCKGVWSRSFYMEGFDERFHT